MFFEYWLYLECTHLCITFITYTYKLQAYKHTINYESVTKLINCIKEMSLNDLTTMFLTFILHNITSKTVYKIKEFSKNEVITLLYGYIYAKTYVPTKKITSQEDINEYNVINELIQYIEKKHNIQFNTIIATVLFKITHHHYHDNFALFYYY